MLQPALEEAVPALEDATAYEDEAANELESIWEDAACDVELLHALDEPGLALLDSGGDVLVADTELDVTDDVVCADADVAEASDDEVPDAANADEDHAPLEPPAGLSTHLPSSQRCSPLHSTLELHGAGPRGHAGGQQGRAECQTTGGTGQGDFLPRGEDTTNRR